MGTKTSHVYMTSNKTFHCADRLWKAALPDNAVSHTPHAKGNGHWSLCDAKPRTLPWHLSFYR
eukprot:690522-Prorocentrum_lima.AAC.1